MSEETETAAPEAQQTYDWSAFRDDEGRIYYYNSKTEESSWEAPEEGFNPPLEPDEAEAEQQQETEAEQSDQKEEVWIAYKDDEGREYYYNNSTGETQWEKPDGKIEAAPIEEEEAEEPTAMETEQEEPSHAEEQKTEKGSTAAEAKVEQMEVDESPEEPEEEIDPAVKRAQEAEKALNQPDSVMEPKVISNVTEMVTNEEGEKAFEALIHNFGGQTAVCGLLGRWLADLRSSSSSSQPDHIEQKRPSEATADEIRETVQDAVNRIAKERFSKETGDRILDLSKSEAAFLEDMMDSPRWRKLLIDLYSSHKDSAVLKYCLGAISNRGHHREIAKRVNLSEHFAVFNAMLLSELAVIGRLAVSAGKESTTTSGLEEIVHDLRRACTATSYTYLYSLEVIRNLEKTARDELNGSSSIRFRRAIRKWERLGQDLESAMVNPAASTSVAGSSRHARNRRLDVALTASELHQRQRRRHKSTGENGTNESSDTIGGLETALLNFLRRHSMGTQVDDAILDPLLPTGLDSMEALENSGKLLIQHPLAIRALLGYLYKPGSTRVTALVVKNKCARLVALASVAAEKAALQELCETEATPENDEVALTRMILQGSQLCEQLEIMVSFLVTDSAGQGGSGSPGQKLCSLAFQCATVAQGVIMWAREFTSGPEFANSPSYPTMSVSILSLVRLLSQKQPFTRGEALLVALAFLRHSSSEISYQKVNAIKEQSLRLLIFLLISGDVDQVLGSITSRLEDKRNSELDPSLIRYFVGSIAEVIRPPFSLLFVRSFGLLLKTAKCVDAVRSRYFDESRREKLVDLLEAFKNLQSDAAVRLTQDDTSLISSLLATYQE